MSLYMPTPQAKSENQRLVFLDWLRVFAFSSVLFWHFFYLDLQGLLVNPDPNSPELNGFMRGLLELLLPLMRGSVGVTVFFLVSGYIITHILYEQSPLEFVIKRIFRIYPLYIATVLITYLIAWEKPNFSVLIPQLLLIGDVFHTPYALNGIEWTLRVEMMFYSIMVALKFMGFFDTKKQALPWVFVIAAVGANYFSPFPAWIDITKASYSIAFQFLFLGCVIYLYDIKKVNWMFLIFFIALSFYDAYYLINLYHIDSKNDTYPILAFGVFVLVWLSKERLKINPVVVFLSNLTFAVYVLHTTVLGVLELLDANYLHIHSKIFFDTILMIVLVIVCYLLHRYVEKPFNKIGQILAKQKTH
jgi:peptidoglycan/LPS O-acetylase OafA/YrhL